MLDPSPHEFTAPSNCESHSSCTSILGFLPNTYKKFDAEALNYKRIFDETARKERKFIMVDILLPRNEKYSVSIEGIVPDQKQIDCVLEWDEKRKIAFFSQLNFYISPAKARDEWLSM